MGESETYPPARCTLRSRPARPPLAPTLPCPLSLHRSSATRSTSGRRTGRACLRGGRLARAARARSSLRGGAPRRACVGREGCRGGFDGRVGGDAACRRVASSLCRDWVRDEGTHVGREDLVPSRSEKGGILGREDRVVELGWRIFIELCRRSSACQRMQTAQEKRELTSSFSSSTRASSRTYWSCALLDSLTLPSPRQTTQTGGGQGTGGTPFRSSFPSR